MPLKDLVVDWTTPTGKRGVLIKFVVVGKGLLVMAAIWTPKKLFIEVSCDCFRLGERRHTSSVEESNDGDELRLSSSVEKKIKF